MSDTTLVNVYDSDGFVYYAKTAVSYNVADVLKGSFYNACTVRDGNSISCHIHVHLHLLDGVMFSMKLEIHACTPVI